MAHGRTLGLWIAAGVLLMAAGGLYFYEPASRDVRGTENDRAELDAAIAKAATYYEFGHYERAVESYRSAIERGMSSGVEWYRYARSIELAGADDLHEFAHAYALLLAQSPDHEYVAEVESLLRERSKPFDFEGARAGEIPHDSLVNLSGTISHVVWGRILEERDTLIIATREDDWLGHSGDEVVVGVPRRRRYRPGEAIDIVGFYSGWCTRDDGAGLTRDYPCVEAAGTRVVTP